MKKKQIASILLCAVMVVGMTAGCGQKAGGSALGDGQPSSVSRPANKKGITLTVGLKSSHVEISNIDELKKGWEEKTGNKIDVQAIGEEFDSMLQTKLSTGGMWDIFIGDTGTQAAPYQMEKNMADLSDEPWVVQLTDAGRQFVTNADGKIYCFPNGGVNSFGIVYNKEVFETNGLEIPKTFDDFNGVCSKLKAAGITPIYFSMSDAWTVNQIMNGEWPNILAANPSALDKLNKNEIRWDSLPEFDNLFVRIKGWADLGYVNSDLATATYEMGEKAIASGTAAMMYMGDWADPEFIKTEPSGKNKIGMFAAPNEAGDGRLAVAGPGGYYISNQSRNIEAAKDFINYLAGGENLKKNMDARGCTSVWKDVEPDQLSGTLKDTQKYVDEGMTEIHYNQSYVIVPPDDANSAFMSVLLGQKTPEQCAKIWSDAIIVVGKQLGFDGFK